MGYQLTRPDADQLKFTSSKTGEHILEDYLQDAEIGNRTLFALLNDIFDSSGTLRSIATPTDVATAVNAAYNAGVQAGLALGYANAAQASAVAAAASAASIAAGPVVSINSMTGIVTLAKADIGLGNADNTSDANKPVSTATQTALNLKANLGTNTFSADQNYGGFKNINQILQQTAEVKAAPAISGGVLALDCVNAASAVALNANITSITLANTLSSGAVVQSHTIIFTADGTARTIAWPAGNGTSTLLVKWANGTAPTMTSTNGKRDVIMLMSVSQFLWDAFVVGQNL